MGLSLIYWVPSSRMHVERWGEGSVKVRMGTSSMRRAYATRSEVATWGNILLLACNVTHHLYPAALS